MTQLMIINDPAVEEKFKAYPEHIRPLMEKLRELVVSVASESESIGQLWESLKWGEPSYRTKKGSTLRMDWKEKTPNQYAMYFQCTSKLVPTFKAVFGDTFKYEGNRALIFALDDKLPEQELKACIEMCLQYHSLKDKPLLGMAGG